MHRKQLKPFFLGFVFALVLSFSLSSFAGTGIQRTITAAFGGLSIVMDGVRMSPKDVNNNEVQPILYGGTTYVPIRFLSEALGKKVTFIGATSSIYIGEQQKVEAFLLRDIKPVEKTVFAQTNYGSYGGWKATEYAADKRFTIIDWSNTGILTIDDREYTSQSMMLSDGVRENNATYNLNGRYKRILGKFGVDDLSTNTIGTMGYVELLGDGKQLARVYNSRGHAPVSVDVDLTGVNSLKIRLVGSATSNQVAGATVYSAQVVCDFFDVLMYPVDPANTQP